MIESMRPRVKKESFPQSGEPLNQDVETQIAQLRANIASLNAALQRTSPAKAVENARAEEGDEGIRKLASKANMIIGGVAALVAIPVVAAIIEPKVASKIFEWNAAAEHFVLENPVKVLGLLTALTLVLCGDVAWKEIEMWKKGPDDSEE